MNAFIIGCNEEFNDHADLLPECNFFSSNYSTYISLKDFGVRYLYDLTIDITKTPSDLEFLSKNWFRDDKGCDIFAKDLVSFAPAITRRVFSSFANDYRNYYAIKKILDNYDLVYLSKFSELSFIRTVKVFKDKVRWHESVSKYDYPDTASPERTIIKNPSKKFIIFSRIAYEVQRLFLKYIRKKILVLYDWTYLEEFAKRDDCLISNYYLPWKAFYFPFSKRILPESKLIFPKKITNSYFNKDFINNKLNKENFSWDQNLIELFLSTVFRVYAESYIVLRQTFSVYSNLLSHYRPNTVVFPGETHFEYIIGVQVAKTLKIKTVLVVDGYAVVKDKRLPLYDHSNKYLLFDKFVAFGRSNIKLYSNHFNIPLIQIIEAKSPLIKNVETKNNISFKYDAIVMSYYPDQHNPNGRWDQRCKIAIDIIKLLHSLGFNSIAIKVKSGAGVDKEVQMYQEQLKDFGAFNYPDIIKGDFNQYLSQTKIFIGPISTSIFEAACGKIPYIVYEPYENGISDYAFSESILVNRDNVARNTQKLSEMIKRQGTSVIASHDDLTSGVPLRELHL